jgi:DNA-binding CsgD family transcriptional regulator
MPKDTEISKSIDAILGTVNNEPVPVCIKNGRRAYAFANEAWSDLAEVTNYFIAGKRDNQLPWGPSNSQFIEHLDSAARKQGSLTTIDRRPHFHQRTWFCTSIEKIYAADKGLLATVVKPIPSDDFATLASQVTEQGLVHDGLSLSVKQLYLLHQLLFHVPHKQTARELGCSLNRIQQHLREIRDQFNADDSKELICALSARSFFPLLEHFDLLFKHRWLADDLKYQ